MHVELQVQALVVVHLIHTSEIQWSWHAANYKHTRAFVRDPLFRVMIHLPSVMFHALDLRGRVLVALGILLVTP